MKKIFLILNLLSMLILAGCAGSGSSNVSSENNQKSSENKLYIAAWYATYDAERGLQSFSNNIRLFNEINPVWYNLNPSYLNTGSPPFVADLRNKPLILSLARSNGVKVLPTIQNFGVSNFDPTVIHSIINDPVARSGHVAEIVNLVVTEGYDGIDIDYENLAANDCIAFSAFITELGYALKQHQKLLSVTVYAKTSPGATWDGPGAQDWAVLARSADTIKIMAYDYHWASFHAGPISPIDWLRDVLNYADSIPDLKGKLIVGLPFYGLDWGIGTAKEVMYQDVSEILNRYAPSNYNRYNTDHSANPICGYYSNNVELHFDYSLNGTSHTVYFQDVEATKKRLSLINQHRQTVKGVTFWHLGGEDYRIWDELGKYK